jgi:uncharacterized protein (DUF2141 family)
MKTAKSSLAALVLAFVSHTEAADLRVDVQGVPAAGGRVLAALFNRAEDFPRDKAVAATFADTTGPSASVLFTDLAPGESDAAGKVDATDLAIKINLR